MDAIEVDELTKSYDGQTVVDHLSLSIPSGEVFALLGPNGAGKMLGAGAAAVALSRRSRAAR